MEPIDGAISALINVCRDDSGSTFNFELGVNDYFTLDFQSTKLLELRVCWILNMSNCCSVQVSTALRGACQAVDSSRSLRQLCKSQSSKKLEAPSKPE